MAEGFPPRLPRVTLRESFDEDDLSDVDDEVFIRDGKNGILKIDDDGGVKIPLMRRKYKTHFSDPPQLSYKRIFAPFCYTFIGLIIILAIIALFILVIIKFPIFLKFFKLWTRKDAFRTKQDHHIAPCTSLNYTLQWSRTLPKLTSEAPLRSIDVNQDNIQDIIVGYSTGLDRDNPLEYFCTLYLDKSGPCFGGVLAIDGKSGKTLWTHWTSHAIFSVDCSVDLNNDKVNDCIIAGRGGILEAVNGRNGSSIWEWESSSNDSPHRFYDIYDIRYINDIDNDEIRDIVASHTWRSKGPRSEIIVVSAKGGNKIISKRWKEEQLFVAPQLIVHPDGENYFILAARDENKSGGLYIISYSELFKGESQPNELNYGIGKGVSLPPLLIDINSDGTEDIIVAMFNSTVMAIDGLTFKEIWNYTIIDSEVISIPIPGYYNDDSVPDFMVQHQIGTFPVYYYSVATVLDGKTGKPLLEKAIENSMSRQMAGISITVDGYGNDWFLHWSANCLNKEGKKDKYKFFNEPEENADLCLLRFNSTLITSLLAFSQHVEPPGIPLYQSKKWEHVEFNNFIDPRKEADDYFASHSYRNQPLDTIDIDQNKEKVEPIKYVNSENVEDNEKVLNSWRKNYWETQGWENEKSKVNTDDNLEDLSFDDVNEKIAASKQLNEIRLQRSEKNSGRYINNDTNDVQNQLDPSMDYTNGQSKSNNYYTSLNNRTSNSEDNMDYFNLPDIDFVDNMKDAEILSDKRKREVSSELDELQADQNQSPDIVHHNKPRRKKREAERKVEKPNGLQKQSPTGLLLPSLKSDIKNSVDLVFSTYWLPSSPTPFVLLSQDLECIENTRSQSILLPGNAIVAECLRKRGIDYQAYEEAVEKKNVQIPLGQMTVYRMQLQCICPEDLLPGQSCKDISKHQSWPQYLGTTGNGYFSSLNV